MDTGLKNKILTLFNKGKTYREISKQLNCSKSNISHHCSRFIKKDERYSEVNLVKYRKHYETYGSVTKAAKFFKLNVGYLRQKLKLKKVKPTEIQLKTNRKKSVCDWRRRKKIKAIAYKGGKCQNCNYSK